LPSESNHPKSLKTALRSYDHLAGWDLLKRCIGEGREFFRFSGHEPSFLVRFQHQLQSPLDELVVSVLREGFMTLAVTSVPLYCRVSLDKPKIMKKAKGSVRESKSFRGSQRRTFVENIPWLNTLQNRALSFMEIRDVLAVNLRKYRRAKGLSQEELAHQADIDRTYISSLERSVYAAGIDVVDRLARVLGLEAADLLRRPSKSGRRIKNNDSKQTLDE
jgi:ribosome-binding protein aMBF1 (putative translation factor)